MFWSLGRCPSYFSFTLCRYQNDCRSQGYLDNCRLVYFYRCYFWVPDINIYLVSISYVVVRCDSLFLIVENSSEQKCVLMDPDQKLFANKSDTVWSAISWHCKWRSVSEIFCWKICILWQRLFGTDENLQYLMASIKHIFW